MNWDTQYLIFHLTSVTIFGIREELKNSKWDNNIDEFWLD